MESIEIKPSYTPLIQKPFCCNAACLQMILLRRGLPMYTQDLIAKELGVKIEETDYLNTKTGRKSRVDKNSFMVDMDVAHEGEELGIGTVDSEDKVNEFFSKHNLPLRAKAYRASKIVNLRDFIIGNIASNNDQWVEFHLDERESEPVIHDNVIQGVNNSEVVTVDPWFTFRQIVKWPLDMLERSIGTKYGRSCGIVVISPE